MKKYGIIGSHGVCKTTLAFELALKYKKENPFMNVKIIEEVARKCPYPINEATTQRAQRWIWAAQMVAELEGMDNDILICDRTILDNLAYAKFAGFDHILKDFLNISVNWMSTYHKIYWLRPNDNFRCANDNVRSTDVDFQRSIDKILAGWIQKFQINVIEGGKA